MEENSGPFNTSRAECHPGRTRGIASFGLNELPILGLIFFLAGCGQKPGTTSSPMEPITTSTGIRMVQVPGGTFQMGSGQGQPDEQPAHAVTLKPFLMDQFEVTQEFYEKLCHANPSHYKGANLPVEQLSWSRAVLFCNARSRAEGLEPCYDEKTGECHFDADGYRLPTEAEWEYACRAGSNDAFCFGKDPHRLREYGWFAENSGKVTHAPGLKKANAWGLYDLYGNVAEWCNDVYAANYYQTSPSDNPKGPATGDKQVLRGGGHSSSANACRSAYRAGEAPGTYDGCFARDDIGFRCVRVPRPVRNVPK